MSDYNCHYCNERCSMMGHTWCQQGLTREEYLKQLVPAVATAVVVPLPKVGDRLLTKDGRKYGNGIIIGYGLVHDEPMISYQIMSDFGNVFFKRADQLDEFWWVDSSEDNSAERWHSDREQLAFRSRSSMAEQGTVDPQDAGSVPAVTANSIRTDFDGLGDTIV